MSTETTTVTHYGVARGEKVISTSHPSVSLAQEALGIAEQQMIAVGLDPDLRLVEYDVETVVKTSRVRAYRQPEPEDVAPAEQSEVPAE